VPSLHLAIAPAGGVPEDDVDVAAAPLLLEGLDLPLDELVDAPLDELPLDVELPPELLPLSSQVFTP